MSFEWNSEETKESWQHALPATQAGGRSLRRIVIVIAILATLGVASLAGLRLLNSQIEGGVNLVEEGVVASFDVIMDAATRDDYELVSTFLSGRDQAWSDALVLQVAKGTFLDRRPFGMAVLPRATSSDPPRVTMSTDLRTAEISWQSAYAIDIGRGQTGTIRLEQSAVYRAGPESWLLSPPEESYWGQSETSQGYYLRLSYPARDGELGRRLALDLDEKLAEMCGHLQGINCPAGYQVTVGLSSDLALLDLPSPLSIPANPRPLQLPAPTLIGVPLDETGYRALFRGYALHIVARAVAELSGYECCQREAFFQAMLDKQFSQLGLRPWSMTENDYQQLIKQPFRWEDLQPVWSAGGGEIGVRRQQLYALIDFVIAEGTVEANLANMQRELMQPYERYLEWAAQFLGPGYELDPFIDAWLRFIYRQTESGRIVEPILSPPDQAIRLLCGDGNVFGESLSEINPANGQQSVAFPGGAGYRMVGTLGDGAFIVQQPAYSLEGRTLPATLWRRGRLNTRLWVETVRVDLNQPLELVALDPTGRKAVLASRRESGDVDRHLMLNLDECGDVACMLERVTSEPVWSPAGEFTLVLGEPVPSPGALSRPQADGQSELFLGDAAAGNLNRIGAGSLPFWLDGATFGYVAPAPDGMSNGLLLDTAPTPLPADPATPVLSSSELAVYLGPAAESERLFISSIAAAPDGSDRLAVVASTSTRVGVEQHLLFLVQLNDSRQRVSGIELLYRSDETLRASFSPNGRWLSVNVAQEQVVLLSPEAAEPRTVGRGVDWTGWSADGSWLAQSFGEYLLLDAPDYNYQRILLPRGTGCRAIGWVIEP